MDTDPELSAVCAARLARLAEDVASAAVRVAGSSTPGGAPAAVANRREALAVMLGRHAADLTSVADDVRRAAHAMVQQENAVLDELRVVEQNRLTSGPSLITRVLG